MKNFLTAIGALALMVGMLPQPGWSSDRHEGYYYPKPDTVETYQGRAPLFKDADRRSRTAFAAGIASQLSLNPAVPAVSVFPKGVDGEKLIMVALREGELDTLYRIRGFLALMTAVSRTTPLFANAPHPENLTFLDFLASLGFELLTVSDGGNLAHQIELKAAP